MKEFLEFLVRSIVTRPDEVKIYEENPEDTLCVFKIEVDKEDMGLIIGKEGRIIKAIRSLMRLKALKEEKRVRVDLLEV